MQRLQARRLLIDLIDFANHGRQPFGPGAIRSRSGEPSIKIRSIDEFDGTVRAEVIRLLGLLASTDGWIIAEAEANSTGAKVTNFSSHDRRQVALQVPMAESAKELVHALILLARSTPEPSGDALSSYLSQCQRPRCGKFFLRRTHHAKLYCGNRCRWKVRFEEGRAEP